MEPVKGDVMVPETTLTALGNVEAGKGQEVDRLRRQVEVMLAHVLDLGLTPAPQAWMFEAVRDRTVVDLNGDGWNTPPTDSDRMLATEALVRAHRELSRVVAPARPATLELLHDYREGRRPPRPGGQIPRQGRPASSSRTPKKTVVPPAGSTVPLVRWLMTATVVFLVAFVLLAAVPEARRVSAGYTYREPDFAALLLRELFLLTAAALGAGLTAVYRAGREVARGSYDPEFDHTFLQRILLGMASGLVIAELIPLGNGDDGLSGLARPAVALIGGFAADVVHGVLSRLMAALETLFNGGQVNHEEAQRELAEKRAEEVLAQADRATLNKLLEIRRIASSGAPTRAIIEEIDRVITVVAAPV
ncbi:hypothetical protein KIH74_16135 [Kineosporia sp. J2-2]|uniref:Uncharacterized protein n=1 Tax=Kineosporia corallincola TaxID=2835133 RepID=A0ABS5TJ99_9ACTN|nr:hypothetical protein [Kineosporia corallincola]MBT0770474.1 hypothetical protein [Kineosporia corallincola]